MKRVFIALVWISLSLSSRAQTDSAKVEDASGNLFRGAKAFRSWSIGINGGFSQVGSLPGGMNDYTVNKPGYGVGLYLQKDLTHFLSLRADVQSGSFSGDNSRLQGDGTKRVLKYHGYETKVAYAGSLNAVFSILNVNWLSKKNTINLFGTIGMGSVAYTSEGRRTSDSVLEKLKSSGNATALFLPIGVGAKVKLSNAMALELGYRVHFIDGDNLDMTHFGTNQDKYGYGYIGLQFMLGKKSKPALTWHNPAKEWAEETTRDLAQMRNTVEEILRQNQLLSAQMENLKTDTDGDGVIDLLDKCPGTSIHVKVNQDGCEIANTPTTTTRETKTTVPPPTTTTTITDEDRLIAKEAQASIAFQPERADLLFSSNKALDKLALLLIQKGYKLKLIGHTDNIGDDNYNLFFSKARAESVKSYLVNAGISSVNIDAIGYGETQPIAPNNTPEGRKKNNRVEVVLIEK